MLCDAFICCAPKDESALPDVVASLRSYTDVQDIYVCSPSPLQCQVDVLNVLDHEVLDCRPDLWRYRPNWIKQQFLKLFQHVTRDWYFVVDCDTILLRQLDLFVDGRPVWLLGAEQSHQPYWKFQIKMCELYRNCEHSFISHTGLYDRAVIDALLRDHHHTVDSFLRKSYDIVAENCLPSESQIYGTYVVQQGGFGYIFRRPKQWEGTVLPPREWLLAEGFELATCHRWELSTEYGVRSTEY
jgi:hypothetical protein